MHARLRGPKSLLTLYQIIYKIWGQFYQRVYDVFFVLKISYEVRTLKIGFHQTIELCELLTFCRIFKTNI